MGLSNLLPMVESVVSAEGYSYVWAVVITGLAVVFASLVILIAFVWLMGKFFSMGNNKKKISAEPVTATKPVTQVPVRTVNANTATADDDEIIAVISAAVAAMGQAEGKTYRVKSVRAVNNRASRSAWAMAGLQQNTAPF
ncbi:MAG: OadG family protein [Oscillospiraceae bacterium]|nr:OadG family protein [Oscillospiraceae bacterium]